jgi:hypothetical protein
LPQSRFTVADIGSGERLGIFDEFIRQMPDLDLIIQTKQGMRAFGNGDPVALWRTDNAATNAGGLLLICCRNRGRIGDTETNGCSYC